MTITSPHTPSPLSRFQLVPSRDDLQYRVTWELADCGYDVERTDLFPSIQDAFKQAVKEFVGNGNVAANVKVEVVYVVDDSVEGFTEAVKAERARLEADTKQRQVEHQKLASRFYDLRHKKYQLKLLMDEGYVTSDEPMKRLLSDYSDVAALTDAPKLVY